MPATVETLCRHCAMRPGNRVRGLCAACYYTPSVRRRYRSGNRWLRCGLGLLNRSRPLPVEPTAALPGTRAKVAVLVKRAALGVGLWHPRDAPEDD